MTTNNGWGAAFTDTDDRPGWDDPLSFQEATRSGDEVVTARRVPVIQIEPEVKEAPARLIPIRLLPPVDETLDPGGYKGRVSEATVRVEKSPEDGGIIDHFIPDTPDEWAKTAVWGVAGLIHPVAAIGIGILRLIEFFTGTYKDPPVRGPSTPTETRLEGEVVVERLVAPENGFLISSAPSVPFRPTGVPNVAELEPTAENMALMTATAAGGGDLGFEGNGAKKDDLPGALAAVAATAAVVELI